MIKHLARVNPSVFREENPRFLPKILTYSSIISEIQILMSHYTTAVEDQWQKSRLWATMGRQILIAAVSHNISTISQRKVCCLEETSEIICLRTGLVDTTQLRVYESGNQMKKNIHWAHLGRRVTSTIILWQLQTSVIFNWIMSSCQKHSKKIA